MHTKNSGRALTRRVIRQHSGWCQIVKPSRSVEGEAMAAFECLECQTLISLYDFTAAHQAAKDHHFDTGHTTTARITVDDPSTSAAPGKAHTLESPAASAAP